MNTNGARDQRETAQETGNRKKLRRSQTLERMTVTQLEPLWRRKRERIWRKGGKPPIMMTKRQKEFLKEEEVHVMITKRKCL